MRYDGPGGKRRWRQRSALYTGFTTVVAILVGSALVEAMTSVALYGVDTSRAHAEASGTQLEVRYPALTRGQLDSPVHVVVRHSGGFDEPVTIAVSSSYLALFVTDDVSPQPSSEATDGDMLLMTFDPPVGDVLDVDLDLAAKPWGWFQSEVGIVRVVERGSVSEVVVRISTDVRP